MHSFGVFSHVCGGMYLDAAGSYFWTFAMTVGVAAAEWGLGGGGVLIESKRAAVFLYCANRELC